MAKSFTPQESTFRELPPLDKKQRIALVSLLAFSLFFLVFSTIRFKNQIYSPFEFKGQATAQQNELATSTDMTGRNQDTDQDGLTDFEETSIYSTSIYLEDSDSDGFNDADEVKNGTDPNCPSGQNCSIDTTVVVPANATSTEASSTDQALQSMLTGNTDAALLRQLLIDNGVDKNILDQISDEELLASYRETLDNQE